jgi:hypothetical protein
MTCAQENRRAAHFKALTLELRHRVAVLERELKAARSAGYINGSAAMMAAVHDALDDGDLSLWISQRLLAQRTRVPPFHLSPEKEAMVREEIAALLKACGIKSDISEIAL